MDSELLCVHTPKRTHALGTLWGLAAIPLSDCPGRVCAIACAENRWQRRRTASTRAHTRTHTHTLYKIQSIIAATAKRERSRTVERTVRVRSVRNVCVGSLHARVWVTRHGCCAVAMSGYNQIPRLVRRACVCVCKSQTCARLSRESTYST